MDAESESVWRQRRAVTLDDDEEVRNTMPAFSHDPMYDPDSPYRGGSYELLVALATRRAAIGVLKSMDAQPTSSAARAVLSAHCDEHGLFAGALAQHPADAWMATLLDRPISLTLNSAGGGPALADPRAVVEELLESRANIAKNYIEQLTRVPEAVLQIKRDHVSRSLAF